MEKVFSSITLAGVLGLSALSAFVIRFISIFRTTKKKSTITYKDETIHVNT